MNEGYGAFVRLAHWATVLLVAVQFVLVLLNALLYEPRPVLVEWLVQAHISSGVIIFALTCVRLLMRLRSRASTGGDHALLRRIALGVHVLLYGCLLVLPIAGYVRLAALGFEIQLFGLVSLPAFPLSIDLARLAATAHMVLAVVLTILVIVHAGAAIFHSRIDGTSVLPRMDLRNL